MSGLPPPKGWVPFSNEQLKKAIADLNAAIKQATEVRDLLQKELDEYEKK